MVMGWMKPFVKPVFLLWGGGGYPRNADIIVNWVSVQNKWCTIYVVYHNQWLCIYKYIHRNTVYHCVRCWSKGTQASNIEIDATRGIKSWFASNLKRKNTCLTKPVVSCAAWWGWTLLSVLCVLGRYMYIIYRYDISWYIYIHMVNLVIWFAHISQTSIFPNWPSKFLLELYPIIWCDLAIVQVAIHSSI